MAGNSGGGGMQTAGGGLYSSGDKEEELRRRNAEVDQRRNEALRLAHTVVQQQEAKLASSPAANRSPGRQGRYFEASSPGRARESQSSNASRNIMSPQRYTFDDENEVGDEVDFEDEQRTPRDDEDEDEEEFEAGVSPSRRPQSQGAGKRNTTTPQMGSEATIRYLKAKLAVVEEELAVVLEQSRNKEDKTSLLEQKNKELEDALSKTTKSSESSKVKLDKMKAELQEKTKLAESLERQLATTLREQESMQKQQRQTESATGQKDVRLNRALEEVERYKKLLHDGKQGHAEQLEQARRQLDTANAEKKRLGKQKAELMTAFRNQMKLIDVLKRQVIHLQAAKLLELTEEDFTRALEMGEQM